MKEIGVFERAALAYMISYLQKFPSAEIPLQKSDAWTIGVTGVTGAGKSTLIKKIALELRKKDMRTVALLIDPSSQKHGWAILGDRRNLRGSGLDLDKGIFIRSLATRGESSALAASLSKIIAYSKLFADAVVVETAGAGQTDVKIRSCVDTLIQVLGPLGDELNLKKAGQSEETDIFVINDREEFPSAKKFFAAAQMALEEFSDSGWKKRICLLNAQTGKGIEEFAAEMFIHKNFIKKPA